MTYLAPKTVDQALAQLAGGSVCVVAGGTDYFPALKKGQGAEKLLDVTRIAAMQGISSLDSGWRIGAATTWSEIVKADLPPVFDGLKAAARDVGSIQIQNAGTIGGNLCNASPAADGVPPLLTLDAEVEITGAHGVRTLPLANFLKGARQTELGAGELLTAITIPPQPGHLVSGFEKLGSRRYLVISITMSAVVLGLEYGRITDLRMAIGACSATAQRQPRLESALLGADAASAIVTSDMFENLSPIDDVRGDGDYRLLAAAAQCQRAIRSLAAA